MLRAAARATLAPGFVAAIAVALALAMVPAHAADVLQTFKRHAEGYEIQVPAPCTVEQADKRLTATCPASLQPSLVAGKDKAALDETFVLEIISTPVPAVDLTLPGQQMSQEMARIACGADLARTSLARVDTSFSIQR